MFEAYAIGVTLKLNNLISPQLVMLAKEFERLEELSVSLNSTLHKIGQESAALRSIAAAGDATGRALERASLSASNLQRHLAGIKAAGEIPTGASPTMLPGGSGRGGGHRGGVHGGNIHMGSGGVGVSTVGFAAGDAFVPIAVGAGMVWAAHSMYESAKDLNTEMARFKLFGMSDKINAEAFKFVHGMHIYGASETENMKNFREAQGVFRESGLDDSRALEGAKLAAPVLSKIMSATASMDEESQARLRTSSMSMLRFVEMSGGLKDAETFNKLADFGWRMVQTSGGAVDWEQLRQFKATAGVSARSITNDGLAGLEPIIAELKGGRAGTSLRTAFNRLNGIIRLPNQAAHELVKGGIWDANKIIWNSQGGIKQFKGNPFTSADEFQKNPTQWYETHMIPMYNKMKLTQEQRARENAMLFGSTGGALFSLVEYALPNIHKSVNAQKKALGIDDSMTVEKNSLSGQEREFTAAWTDFKTVFGKTALPQFTAMLKDASAVLRWISDLTANNKFVSFLDSALRITHPLGAVESGANHVIHKLFGGDTVAPAKSQQPVQVHTQINMDGRKVASAVSTHQAKALLAPTTGNGFDLSVAQPGVNLRTN